MSDGTSSVTLSGDKTTVVDIWDHALSELLSLKQALLNEPAESTDRLTSSKNVLPDERASDALMKRKAEEDGASKADRAKEKLQRLEAEAKVRKAKYAGVGMTHVAAAMMKS